MRQRPRRRRSRPRCRRRTRRHTGNGRAKSRPHRRRYDRRDRPPRDSGGEGDLAGGVDDAAALDPVDVLGPRLPRPAQSQTLPTPAAPGKRRSRGPYYSRRALASRSLGRPSVYWPSGFSVRLRSSRPRASRGPHRSRLPYARARRLPADSDRRLRPSAAIRVIRGRAGCRRLRPSTRATQRPFPAARRVAYPVSPRALPGHFYPCVRPGQPYACSRAKMCVLCRRVGTVFRAIAASPTFVR